MKTVASTAKDLEQRRKRTAGDRSREVSHHVMDLLDVDEHILVAAGHGGGALQVRHHEAQLPAGADLVRLRQRRVAAARNNRSCF